MKDKAGKMGDVPLGPAPGSDSEPSSIYSDRDPAAFSPRSGSPDQRKGMRGPKALFLSHAASVATHVVILLLFVVFVKTQEPVVTRVLIPVDYIEPEVNLTQGEEPVIGRKGAESQRVEEPPLLQAEVPLDLTLDPAEAADAKPDTSDPLREIMAGGGGGEPGGSDSKLAGLWSSGPGEIYLGGGRGIGSGTGGFGGGWGGGEGGGIGTGRGSGRGPGSGSGSGQVAFFGSRATAQKVVYIVDKSGSMGEDGKLGAVISELTNSLKALSAYAWFNVIFYDRANTVPFKPRLVRACPLTKQEGMQFLGTITAGGGTDPIPSLKIAYDNKPDVIFLLSDGLFDRDVATFVKSQTLRLGRGAVPIYTIGFRQEYGADLLREIARITGGTYRSVW